MKSIVLQAACHHKARQISRTLRSTVVTIYKEETECLPL